MALKVGSGSVKRLLLYHQKGERGRARGHTPFPGGGSASPETCTGDGGCLVSGRGRRSSAGSERGGMDKNEHTTKPSYMPVSKRCRRGIITWRHRGDDELNLSKGRESCGPQMNISLRRYPFRGSSIGEEGGE